MDSLELPHKKDLESPRIFEELIKGHRHLALLKGIVHILPNEEILLNNLTLQEAKDSSGIENIVTTQDSLYKYPIGGNLKGNDKEVYNYSKALRIGSEKVRSQQGISLNTILEIQALIEPNRPGFRKIPGTVLKNDLTQEVIYTPPSPEKILPLMGQLEEFINQNSYDPLLKMAIIHHSFESIHPFYDGNGRTGRIINILYLILADLLEGPHLYLSRYILRHRGHYYRLLQEVREKQNWADWIIYLLRGISTTAQETKGLIEKIDKLFRDYKKNIRDQFKFYSHDLINNIFSHPYTKASFLAEEMSVSRATSIRYLEALAQKNFLKKNKLGRENYYINQKLFDLLKDSHE